MSEQVGPLVGSSRCGEQAEGWAKKAGGMAGQEGEGEGEEGEPGRRWRWGESSREGRWGCAERAVAYVVRYNLGSKEPGLPRRAPSALRWPPS